MNNFDQMDRHDADGDVYLAYFRNDLVLGFVWDGNIEHPVQVTPEMGEPIIDTFEVPDAEHQSPGATADDLETNGPGFLFAMFKRWCDNYAADKWERE
jgi:hypothetical protein